MQSIPLLALSAALVGLLSWDPTGDEAPAPEPCCTVPARKPLVQEQLLVEPEPDLRSVIAAEQEQAAPAPLLPAPMLPSGLLLDPDATDEEYASQHAGLRADELVRLAHRIEVYLDHADEEQIVALASERTWLDQERIRRLSALFHGALPANLHDRDADHEKAFANMSIEDMKVAAFRVDHAFQFERERLAEQRYVSGLYKMRPAPSPDS